MNMERVIKKMANAFARTKRCGKATHVVFHTGAPALKTTVIREYGYYKNTTGEKVPQAYLTNFGWKNTHYEHAVCVVSVSRDMFV